MEELERKIGQEVVFGTNMRAGADYRRHLAQVLFQRAVKSIEGMEEKGSERE